MEKSAESDDKLRYERIFKKLDRNHNGKIDINDLRDELGLSENYAQTFIKQSDANESGDVSISEFISYLEEHEKNLKLQFSQLDRNHDGKVDLYEMIHAFNQLGINIDRSEALKLFNRMDQDGSLYISYDEWRDYLLLAPSSDLSEILKYWRHSVYIDIGEDLNVPVDFTAKEMQTGKWWRHLVAGACAGAASRTCTAPLDRIKVVLQVQHGRQSIANCFRDLLREGGWRSLWRGNGINVLKIAPESAIKFAVYEQVKRAIRGPSERPLGIYERFVAGAVAGCVAQSSIYPMEVLKTRLALRKTGQYSSIVDAAHKIYRAEGMRSFYRGYLPNLLGIIPYAGIDLAVYETLKKSYLARAGDKERPSVLLLLACGSASSSLGQLCSYPLALVRTRLQAQTVTQASVNLNVVGHHQQQRVVRENTMTAVFRKILRDEGFFGLYRGVVPNFIKVLPAVSISYIVYEFSSDKLGVKMS